MYESERTLLVNETKDTVLEEFDPAGAFQLVAAGGRMPISEAIKYGIVTGDSVKGFKVAKGYGGSIVVGDQPSVMWLGKNADA